LVFFVALLPCLPSSSPLRARFSHLQISFVGLKIQTLLTLECLTVPDAANKHPPKENYTNYFKFFKWHLSITRKSKSRGITLANLAVVLTKDLVQSSAY
jgi:hypothetical protein